MLAAGIADAEDDLGRTPAAIIMAEPLSVLPKKSRLVFIHSPPMRQVLQGVSNLIRTVRYSTYNMIRLDATLIQDLVGLASFLWDCGVSGDESHLAASLSAKSGRLR